MTVDEMKKKWKKMMGKSFDESVKEDEEKAKKAKDEAEKAEKKEESKDESPEEQAKEDDKFASLGERISLIEQSVAKIVEKLGSEETADEDVAVDEDEEEVVVEDEMSCDKEEEKEDKKKEESKDSNELLSKAEILVPGIKKSNTIVKDTLEKFYATAEGKKVLDTFTGGKNPTKLHAETQKAFFHAASEIVKAKRATDTNTVKASAIDSYPALKNGDMTPEKINEMNKKHYGNNK